MTERWAVTWRHTDESPLNAIVTQVASKEEAEKLQAEYLSNHGKGHCYPCSRLERTDWCPGKSEHIVTRVRTMRAIYKTLGFPG